MALLDSARWKAKPVPGNWGTIIHYTEGITIRVTDTTKPPLGAASLQKAFTKIGIKSDGSNSVMLRATEFALYIGLKPKTKD